MRAHNLFLLLYLLGSCFGASNAHRNETCPQKGLCEPVGDSTSHFLQCVGLPSTATGRDHMHRLKGMLEAMMDVYTFMKSSVMGVPLLSLQGELELNPRADPLQNEGLVQMWMEVKIKPLLKSLNKHFLSCLSTKNFSCSSYQTMVREFSHHYADMSPALQKWIYTFFMYPFLSGDRVAGCVKTNESSEEWLMKNFGAFSAMARMRDFSTLNMVFSGLEVLHLLSPAQKAELLLRPEVAGLDNGTLTLIFHNLLTGGTEPPPVAMPGAGHMWTTPGYPPTYTRNSTYSPAPPPPHDSFSEVVNGLMMAFKPVGSFVHDFVSFTHERDMSTVKGATITQFFLNWTLAELADSYRPTNTSVVPEGPEFDVLDVEDWYQQVVVPVLRRFLPNSNVLMHQNITLAFHQVFYLDHVTDQDNETAEIMDVCSISLDKAPCGLTDAVVNVANVVQCAARTNLTMSETTIMRLLVELTGRLNSLMKELSTANFSEVASDFRQIFSEAESPSLIQEHLNDTDFIKLWFKIKLMPLLPDIPTRLLSCLSTKNFTCPVYQTIVAALSKHMSFMDVDPMYSHNIYEHFIYPFLRNHNSSDPQCVLSASNSTEWLENNFGFFSRFASITDFYKLNSNFSGLEVLRLLTPKQLAEMLLLPLPTPPEKPVVIHRVFDFLLESPEERRLTAVLHYVVKLAREVNPPCAVYRHIFERLYGAIPSLPRHVEPATWAGIDDLISVAPEECVPDNITCPLTQYNSSEICRGFSSSDLQSHLNTSLEVPCNFTLEAYACAPLVNFTAHQLASLLKCNLPGNSSHSRALWKILLTKLSNVLDPALDILANMSVPVVVPSALEVLDVIGEIRVSMLTDEQLMSSGVIMKWFSGRLRAFLPSASGRFLHCLSRRNISCQSYQQILKVFIHRFDNMTMKQQEVVLREFVLRFLSHSGPSCVSLANSSAEWLMRNLGPFSAFLSLKELLNLNPELQPLEVLRLLTPKQIAELLVVTLPTLPDKDTIINMIFDNLTESPDRNRFTEFLSELVLLPVNLSCSSYRTLFNRLDLALATASADVASSIMYTKMVLSKHIPPGCIIYSTQCNVTMTNETDICAGVNSTMLQLQLHSGQMNGRFCDFTVEEFACASLSALRAEDLAAMLACNRTSNSSGSRPAWKLLLSKASHVLDAALDLLANKTLDPRDPALAMILDSIREVRLDAFSMASFNNPAFIQLWFNNRLRPFLPAVSPDFLSCLTTRVLSCSTYQQIVQVLSRLQPHMMLPRQMSVYTHFIKVFLTRNDTADRSCSAHINNSGEWLQTNVGGFSVLVSFQELLMLYSNFSAMEALPQLTVRQLAQVSATPGQLTSAAQVRMVMNHVPAQRLPAFFDDYSPAIVDHQDMIPSVVRSAMLQAVFDRANLSDHSVGDAVVLVWLHNRLRPLLINLSQDHVAPFFSILSGRNCSIQQQGLEDLNSTISSLGDVTQKEIHNHIVSSLKGPIPLQCYGDNFNQSFYAFLERSFEGFQFPNLTTFLSLMPPDRMHQLVNSMPPSHLGDFLRRPGVVDNDAELCAIYNNYIQTPVFLETESLPEAVRRPTLPCVWPTALSSTQRSEVNAWFDVRLQNYLGFLTKTLISSSSTNNASCLAFQKFVSVLGGYNYTAADFTRRDVFDTIRAYLPSATVPRCYVPSDPELNSTAWFAEYVGPFLPFLTLEDLQTFGSAGVIQIFTVNLQNIALLNQTVLPLNLTNYYTELVYLQDGNFNPLLLPPVYRCAAPGSAFTQLTSAQSMIVLHSIANICTDLDPQVSAALAGNLGNSIDATAISALGNESTGLSIGQLMLIKPQDLMVALSTLSSVMDWNQGQAKAIIMSLMSAGMLQFNSTSSLLMLGSLVVGIPAGTFSTINGSQLLTASKDSSFLGHLLTAPQIVQQTLVTQIISVNSNSEMVIVNIPDELATEIPRSLLLSFSNTSSVINTLNGKRWKQQQVELFFGVIAVETATATLGSANNLSSSVLQGFTCTAVRSIKPAQIRRLIRACRRTGRDKVILIETQLTCMYNYIKDDSDVATFDLFPHDVLLYYDYSLVPQASCRSYFQQLGDADFTVFSTALSFRLTALFENARTCLGITNTSLTQDNISVLGNMCCTLDGSYIENSDSSILDKLGSCSDLTDAQAAAAEALLQSGNTQYGAPSTWTEQTLRDLRMLPLYLTSTFYDNFNKQTKRRFLRYFLKVLRSNKVDRQKRRRLKREIRLSIRKKSKRSIVSGCTVGNITHLEISDETFPFNYDDVEQFNCCLSASTVKDNLASITDKVDEIEYLAIVLGKLREAYAAESTIPEFQVQLLGPASRQASTEDIRMWNISLIDTLSALMDPSNGEWDPGLAKAIISKYLGKEGNTLSSIVLNSVGGVNLCSLDADALKNISQQSIREADGLSVSNCTAEQKQALFSIARAAFAASTRTQTISVSSYQLTRPYLPGADLSYVRSLAASNVNMDMATFIGLDENVVLNLTVDDVRGLLGTNLPDLKSYENQTLVNRWIRAQFQSDLDGLGLSLTGGKVSTTASPNSTASTSVTPSTASSTSSGTTTGGAAGVRADAGFSFLALLALFVASQHILA